MDRGGTEERRFQQSARGYLHGFRLQPRRFVGHVAADAMPQTSSNCLTTERTTRASGYDCIADPLNLLGEWIVVFSSHGLPIAYPILSLLSCITNYRPRAAPRNGFSSINRRRKVVITNPIPDVRKIIEKAPSARGPRFMSPFAVSAFWASP